MTAREYCDDPNFDPGVFWSLVEEERSQRDGFGQWEEESAHAMRVSRNRAADYWCVPRLWRWQFWRFAWMRPVHPTEGRVVNYAYDYARLWGRLYWKDRWMGSHNDLMPSGCVGIIALGLLCVVLGVVAAFAFDWRTGLATGSVLVGLLAAVLLYLILKALADLLGR
jgi:hypothetical protein